jgi:hypothetical protein
MPAGKQTLKDWANKLESVGKEKVREKRKPKPKSLRQTQEVLITTRPPSDNDPGEVTMGYYFVEDGFLTMVDELGKPLGNPIALKSGDDYRAIAASLTHKRLEGRGFNRRIEYPEYGVA